MNKFLIIELNDGELESVRVRGKYDDAISLAVATAGEHTGVDAAEIEKDLRENGRFATAGEDVIVYVTTAAND